MYRLWLDGRLRGNADEASRVIQWLLRIRKSQMATRNVHAIWTHIDALDEKVICSGVAPLMQKVGSQSTEADSRVFSARRLDPSRTPWSNIIAPNSEIVGSQSHSLRQCPCDNILFGIADAQRNPVTAGLRAKT
jgi:hypothetical protein